MFRRLNIIVVLCSLFLSGCSIFGGQSKDAYKDSRSSKSLEAPPELVIPQADSSYKVPDVVRASEIGNSTGDKSTPFQAAGVIPEYENVTLEREGQKRWLHIKALPAQLWQPLLDFWRDQEFKMEEVNRELGIMQTAWTGRSLDETRGRAASLFSKAFSSIGGGDIREQYRVRLERDEDSSNLYLTYQSQEKTFDVEETGESGPARWQVRTGDTEAEAVMLKRIQKYLAQLAN